MSETPVERKTLTTYRLDAAASFAAVEVQRITMAADFHPGVHWHNGPVLGVIEAGSVYFQVGGGPQSVLRAGDTFYEPGNETITRFDATEEGVTFLTWLPVPIGIEPRVTLGELPG
jgi:quercetin dioxygenase-like cupin family protein